MKRQETTSMLDLSGAHLPVTTPFDPVTGDVDVVALRSNLRRWLEHPLRGIVIGGSTGEAVFLDSDEKHALVDAAREVVPRDCLLIVGTGAESTRLTITATRAAAECGADAVLVKPPAFYRAAMTPEVLKRHYTEVADASPVPVIVYQVPLRLSTLDLPVGLLAELSHHPNIVGVKDSRASLETVGELVEQCDDGFQVLAGAGSSLYAALEVGAVGGIMAMALLAPADSVEICVAFAEGRPADAGRIQERVSPVHAQIVGGMGVPGIKVALDMLGLHGGTPRPPLAPLPETRREEVRLVLEAAGLLETVVA
jgi:4-hydroxy-2-oxoglutarate aldolase